MIDELGGPATFNHYPWGWTWAGNTPFRRWKRKPTAEAPVTRSRCTGRMGSRPEARSAASTPTSSTWSPRSWTRWASKRRPPSEGHPVPDPRGQLRPHLQ
jgi:hypothetical protein